MVPIPILAPYLQRMEKSKRNMLLRVASSYRIVSLTTLQVITGVVPIKLMVMDRKYLYDNRQPKRIKKNKIPEKRKL